MKLTRFFPQGDEVTDHALTGLPTARAKEILSQISMATANKNNNREIIIFFKPAMIHLR